MPGDARGAVDSRTTGPAVPGSPRSAVIRRYGIGDVRDRGAVDRLREQLAGSGLAIFSGVEDTMGMVRSASDVLRVVPHPDSDADGLTTLVDRGPVPAGANSDGFSRRALPAHTDRSGVPHPPALLMTVCVRAAPVGGACVLVDGKAVHDDLVRAAPDAVGALLTPGSALFGGVGGHLGSVLADVPPGSGGAPGGRRSLRLRLDGLAMFCTAVAVRLPVLRAAIDRHAFTLDLVAGEGYLLDNHRWLHGRTAFQGPRAVHRLLGRPGPGLPLAPGIPVGPEPPAAAR